MNIKKNVFLALVVLLPLSGCAPTKLMEITDPMIGGALPMNSEMLERHLVGVVAFDEGWAGNYNRVTRNVLHMQGVKKGTPEYDYRVVRLNINTPESFLWRKKGSHLIATAAVVPDHLPRLKAGDRVEIRHITDRYNIRDFSQTGEGNVVVRIVCAAESPDFAECVESAPSVGIAKGVGPTGTPYPASVAEYGFTFTPWFTAEGNPLRSYPKQ